MRTRARATLLITLALSAVAPATLAQSRPDRGAAEALFDDGRRLMDEKRFDEACAKFEKSQLIEPAVGTLLNLGECMERIGKLASAWTRYKEAGNLAVKLGDQRTEVAGERARAVEPRLSRLTISVSAGEASPGLEIEKDGVRVDPLLLESAIPVDAGHHVIGARAPGRKPWQRELTIAEGEALGVEIPALEVDPTAASVPAAPPQSPRAPAAPTRPAEKVPEVPTRPVPPVVFVLAGVTVLGAVSATYFGLDARAKKTDADETCSPLCDQQTIDDAERSALYCDLSLGVAVAAAAAGTTLFFTRPTVYVGRDAAGLWLDGRF